MKNISSHLKYLLFCSLKIVFPYLRTNPTELGVAKYNFWHKSIFIYIRDTACIINLKITMRIKLRICGLVQGVFFRRSTKTIADRLGLKGYVKNLPDGSVEVSAEGENKPLDELLKFCKKGPQGARVSNVEFMTETSDEEFRGFDIRY